MSISKFDVIESHRFFQLIFPQEDFDVLILSSPSKTDDEED